MRRLVDVLVSSLAGVVLSPVMAVVAVLVRLKLGAPVLFLFAMRVLPAAAAGGNRTSRGAHRRHGSLTRP